MRTYRVPPKLERELHQLREQVRERDQTIEELRERVGDLMVSVQRLAKELEGDEAGAAYDTLATQRREEYNASQDVSPYDLGAVSKATSSKPPNR